jgi:hypothetical protein
METEIENIGLKIAGILLLKNGEISVLELKSLPFFSSQEQIDSVVNFLVTNFDAEISSKRIYKYPIPYWEKVIKIKQKRISNRVYNGQGKI